MQSNHFSQYRENSSSVYGFSDKLEEGGKGELFIASCLAGFGRVHLVTDMSMQKIGIDAFLLSEKLGYVSLQFKMCSKAGQSGNAFIETHICDELKREKTMGWALKTTANSTVYWAVGTGKMYVIDTMEMKRRLSDWSNKYRSGYGCSSENGRTWYGRGILVPLSVIEREVCSGMVEVKEPSQNMAEV